MPLKIGYFLREGTGNLRRNKLMTLAAVLTAAVSLLLVGGVLSLEDFVQGITGNLERRVEVQVFLKDEITGEQQKDIEDNLRGLTVVRDVDYVSKEGAYNEYKKIFADKPALWENVSPDALPASFRVKMRDPNRVDLIRSRLEGNPAVEDVVDQRDTIQRILDVNRVLRTFSAVMVIVLFIAAVLLIANTIQLAIYARRQEVEIMKLVGATNWFVRVPFMLEGVVEGVGGAIIALTLLTLARMALRSRIPAFIPTTSLQGIDVAQVVWLLILGASIGAIGSVVALRRYLEA